MAKLLAKWLSNLITLVLFLILILLVYYTISSKMNGGKPNIAGYEVLTVLSGSMEPGIPTGSIIGVKPVSNKDSLQVGDVITFKAADDANMLITHRIIEIRGEGSNLNFITQGDNNDHPDSDPVLASNVVAKYQDIVIPYIGYVFAYSKTKMGIILMMIVPGAILVLSQIVSVWRMIAKMDDEDDTAKPDEVEEIQPVTS